MSYGTQTNVAGLTNRGKSKFGLRVGTPASSSLYGPDCGKLREQQKKLRHRVNVGTLQKE